MTETDSLRAKPRWRREAGLRDDKHDLVLENPEEVDLEHFKELFDAVVTLSSNRPLDFSGKARDAFRKWFEDPTRPLEAQAYARLSNWFKTDSSVDRDSLRGGAALDFWNALFCAVPRERLTSPKNNGVVLPEKFDVWWSEQLRRQGGL